MQINKYSYFLLLFLLCSFLCGAQELKVMEDVKILPSNIYAARNLRTDSKGRGCAVLLVHSTIPTLKFNGKTIGDIKYESGTYYVFLEPGSTKLEIYDTNNNRIDLKFPKVDVKTTYQTTVEHTVEYGTIECSSDPSGANVELISTDKRMNLGTTPIKGNIDVKAGIYNIEISKKGFVTKTLQSVKISPDKTTKLGTVKLKKQ